MKIFTKLIILTLCFISQNYACDSAGIPIQLARASNYRLTDDVIRHIGFFKIAGEIKDEIATCGNMQNIENRILFFLKNNPQYNSRLEKVLQDSISINVKRLKKIYELQQAIVENDQKKVKELVNKGVMNINLNLNDKYIQYDFEHKIVAPHGLQVTPLRLALKFNRPEIVDFLLQHNALTDSDDIYYINEIFPNIGFKLFKQRFYKTLNLKTKYLLNKIYYLIKPIHFCIKRIIKQT